MENIFCLFTVAPLILIYDFFRKALFTQEKQIYRAVARVMKTRFGPQRTVEYILESDSIKQYIKHRQAKSYNEQFYVAFSNGKQMKRWR